MPSVLDKVQVKAWPADGRGAETLNLFDVPSPGGIATIPLAGRVRGERLDLQVHLDVRPQHNLAAETTVVRRPDLTVTRIDVPDDVVRTRSFSTVVTVAEVGGDIGAAASLKLYDGSTLLTTDDVFVPPNASIPVELAVVLTAPGDHTLRAVLTGSAPAEWDVAPSERERSLYVNRYDSDGVVATDHPLATQAGVDVLRSGGNAFDAAAAVQFVLNVTQPELAGIGGGSNVIVREGGTGRVFAIDARETAPAATTPTTYRRQDSGSGGPQRLCGRSARNAPGNRVHARPVGHPLSRGLSPAGDRVRRPRFPGGVLPGSGELTDSASGRGRFPRRTRCSTGRTVRISRRAICSSSRTSRGPSGCSRRRAPRRSTTVKSPRRSLPRSTARRRTAARA